MLDVAAAGGRTTGGARGPDGAGGEPVDGDDGADLVVFVDRLAAGRTDRATALAHAHVRRSIRTGAAPPGLRRLAEALAAAATELPPPRRPADERVEPVGLVETMRATALAVLADDDPTAVAAAVAALVADGRRVVVTAQDAAELGAVRDALPDAAARRSLDRIPAVAPPELRELRRLLARATPARRDRAGQQLPPPEALPAPAAVAELCAQVARMPPAPPADGTEAVPALLDALDERRRAAVVELAGAATRAVAALPVRDRHPWAWRLLSDLVHNTCGAVDELLADAGAAVRELVLARSAPAVAVTARLPEQALDLLGGYLEFLDGGGRARAYFRAAPQRDVEPVLARVTVDGRRPESADDVRRVVAHLRTAARLRRVDALCPEVGLPRPRTEAELVAMADDLAAVAAAAGAVAALRHDVLFLADGSPVEVPDVDAALRVAAAVLAAGERAAVRGVGRQLDRMADELARSVPTAATAPEHARAVAALRAHDAAAYAAALDGFAAARREVRDETRCRELLDRLAGAAPRLAEAWADGTATGPAAPGFAAFVPADQLLAALPPPDSADVVVVHRAAGLGLDRLLLAAVAPRMVAVGAVPDGRPGVAGDLLGVLRKAAAPVVGGPAADRVPRARAGD